ncbi:MAG: hypothetical protein A2066_19180 [Bacteroidetes bacterium GWB2_41_8]|nr:MAG: hypothetical protein A2066_19180 [Bacteroidetes bacterium GWB2_41_8]
MKKPQLLVFLLLLTFCLACENEAILDEKSKTEIWVPKPIAQKFDSGITIHWLNSVIFNKILLPFTYIDPDKFEIYLSKNDPETLEKVATLSNDQTYSHTFRNLLNGSYYYIAVKAVRKGKESLMSDTIMVIPSIAAKVNQVAASPNYPLETGSMDKTRQILAYVNRNFSWDNGKYGNMSLFIYNLATRVNSIVDTSAYFPDWSPAEMKIVYCTDKHEISKNGRRPQHLAVYDYQTRKISKITKGDVFDLNPEFSNDGKWIVYSSDEGSPQEFNFWKISADGLQKEQLTSNLNLDAATTGNIALGRPSWSPDDRLIYFSVFRQKNKNGIYRISLQNKNIEQLITSGWMDISPIVSPDHSKIALISNRSGNNQIWIYNLITKKYSQITGAENDNISTDWGKIEWIDANTLLYGKYSQENKNDAIYSIEIKP